MRGALFDPVLAGFGDLSAALLEAPQMARRNRLQEAEIAAREKERKDALDQALSIHNENMAARLQEHEDRKAWQDSRHALDLKEFQSLDDNRKANTAMRAAEGLGRGVAKAGDFVSDVLGLKNKTKPAPVAKKDRPTFVDVPDPKKPGETIKALWDDERQIAVPIPYSDMNSITTPAGTALKRKAPGTGYVPEGYVTPQVPVESNWAGRAFATRLNAGDPTFHSIPTAEDFNASNFNPDGTPLQSDALKMAIATTTKGQPVAAQAPADEGFVINEIKSDPVRSAKWNALPPERRAKYTAIFTAPNTPQNERVRLLALEKFRQEP